MSVECFYKDLEEGVSPLDSNDQSLSNVLSSAILMNVVCFALRSLTNRYYSMMVVSRNDSYARKQWYRRYSDIARVNKIIDSRAEIISIADG